ncbi:MAG TPA: nitronate monooxygenase [Gaiellaceae bacterium]|nr:nitronate monooxygenase [Gaiellaceae bacterium]
MASVRTAFCRDLGIDDPILSVGFGIGAGPELTAAVSNAGALGVLGGDGRPRDVIVGDIARTRKLTKRAFGINFVIPVLEHPEATDEDRAEIRGRIEAAIAARVDVLVLFWGDAAPFAEEAHRNGVKLFIQVGSVEEAESAAEAGVDAVIAQGVEAGGHVRGTTSIWDLVPAMVASVHPLPVIASGGIGDGAGIARALAAGAQAVSLGTRFVASDEAWFHPVHKQRVVDSTAADTVYSELYDEWWPGAPHRTLRNKTFEEWDAAGRPPPGRRPGEGTLIGTRRMLSGEVQDWPRYAVGAVPPTFEGDLERVPLLVGESCSVVNDIKPARQIVRDLAAEAEALL